MQAGRETATSGMKEAKYLEHRRRRLKNGRHRPRSGLPGGRRQICRRTPLDGLGEFERRCLVGRSAVYVTIADV